MYGKDGYLAVVDQCAKSSMQKAIVKVKALSDYSRNGEVCLSLGFHLMLGFLFSGL